MLRDVHEAQRGRPSHGTSEVEAWQRKGGGAVAWAWRRERGGGAAVQARWRHGGVRKVEPRRRRDGASEVEAQRKQRRREAEKRRDASDNGVSDGDAARGTTAPASEVR
jgi:hypothetical protein